MGIKQKEETMTDTPMSLEELDKITGGTTVKMGTDGNDDLYGGSGEDFLYGGDGNDTLDGGVRDNADDTLIGGDGNDTAIWGLNKDGSDTFEGGQGNDTLKIDLPAGVSAHDAYNAGDWDIQVKDAAGNPVTITDDMWDNQGNLILPPESSGVITATGGNTLTFSGVETLGKC
jgi:Ca2+-binding RTX toxin-like protein